MAGQGEQLGPGGELTGQRNQGAPDLVLREVVQRQVSQSGVLGGADAVFGAGAAAVPQLEEGCFYGDTAAALLAEVPERQREPMRFGSIEAIRQCAVAGLGVAVLPASIIREEIARGALVDLGLPGLPPYVVHLLRSRSRSLTAAAEVVWRALAGS